MSFCVLRVHPTGRILPGGVSIPDDFGLNRAAGYAKEMAERYPGETYQVALITRFGYVPLANHKYREERPDVT